MIFWEHALQRIELFPLAIAVAFLANSSGFSGGVLFQPLIYFTQGLPLAASIATGIASETIGMSSGAFRYHQMKKIEWKQVRPQLLWIFLGVLAGYIIFQYISSRYLKFILACVLISISILKFYELTRFHVKLRDSSNRFLRRLIGFVGGMGSASTGTGVCELHQPFYEKILLRPVIAANAAAIATEAWGNLWISALNLSWGMIDYTVLIWTGPGVFIGAQLGAMSAHRIPEKFMKLAFSIGVFCIGSFYLFQVLSK